MSTATTPTAYQDLSVGDVAVMADGSTHTVGTVTRYNGSVVMVLTDRTLWPEAHMGKLIFDVVAA